MQAKKKTPEEKRQAKAKKTVDKLIRLTAGIQLDADDKVDFRKQKRDEFLPDIKKRLIEQEGLDEETAHYRAEDMAYEEASKLRWKGNITDKHHNRQSAMLRDMDYETFAELTNRRRELSLKLYALREQMGLEDPDADPDMLDAHAGAGDLATEISTINSALLALPMQNKRAKKFKKRCDKELEAPIEAETDEAKKQALIDQKQRTNDRIEHASLLVTKGSDRNGYWDTEAGKSEFPAFERKQKAWMERKFLGKNKKYK